MRIKLLISGLLIGLVLLGAVGWHTSMAQEEDYILAYEDVFGTLRRPRSVFPMKTTPEAWKIPAAGYATIPRTMKPAGSFTSRGKSASAMNATLYKKKIEFLA